MSPQQYREADARLARGEQALGSLPCVEEPEPVRLKVTAQWMRDHLDAQHRTRRTKLDAALAAWLATARWPALSRTEALLLALRFRRARAGIALLERGTATVTARCDRIDDLLRRLLIDEWQDNAKVRALIDAVIQPE